MAMRWASFLVAKGWTRIALLLCRATMRYWLPLAARGWKRPVSLVKMREIGISHSVMSVWDALVGLGVAGCVVVERMCCRG